MRCEGGGGGGVTGVAAFGGVVIDLLQVCVIVLRLPIEAF